ncbi:hypothetical protein K491DRAFT_91977 [Lophiostoma macrostomum CBS 122681]|uniref:Uncharacterized protein n=1 Tax=Lophiostoma macrostomum CBS 122681 TaxID=1314788 RepID=A0A6A6TMH6_9PLEO|nr:hypothetical protein K491DRAFT_91977 [Lophiostoma macrostomum CBS 122681]
MSTTTYYQSASSMSSSSYYLHRSDDTLEKPLPSFEVAYQDLDDMLQKPLPCFEIEYPQVKAQAESSSYPKQPENMQIAPLFSTFEHGKTRAHSASPLPTSDRQFKRRKLEAKPQQHQWTPTSLYLLASKIYPDLYSQGLLSFHPPLEKLHAGLGPPGPMILTLYADSEDDADSESSKTCDFPTFNMPVFPKRILAQSPWSSSPAEALTSLGNTLLADTALIARLSARYNVLAHLFTHEVARVESIWRGLQLMIKPSSASASSLALSSSSSTSASSSSLPSSSSSSSSSSIHSHTPVRKHESVKPAEWESRRLQLRAVDYTWEIEPLVEAFLLEMGRQEVREWVGIVEDGVGVLTHFGEQGREGLIEWYRDAAEYLRDALLKAGAVEGVRGIWKGRVADGAHRMG